MSIYFAVGLCRIGQEARVRGDRGMREEWAGERRGKEGEERERGGKGVGMGKPLRRGGRFVWRNMGGKRNGKSGGKDRE